MNRNYFEIDNGHSPRDEEGTGWPISRGFGSRQSNCLVRAFESRKRHQPSLDPPALSDPSQPAVIHGNRNRRRWIAHAHRLEVD